MKTGADENGIYIYKLFKKITIPYGDISGIVVKSQDETVITTKDGEEYIEKESYGLVFNFPVVMDKIVEFNISFEDEFIMSDSMDSIMDESGIKGYIDSLLADFRDDARAVIKTRLGERHDLELEVLDIHREKVLCMRLLRDGNAVTDLPDPVKKYDDIDIPISFEAQSLLMLCSWNPALHGGRYVIMLDNDSFPQGNKNALMELVNEFCDDYLEVNSREYLDALP